MATLDEIRSQYPQYKDMSDAELSLGLYNKFYSDMPIMGFAKSMGMDKTQSLDFLKLAHEKTGQGVRFKQPEASTGGLATSIGRSALQGLTLGGGEEVVAGGVSGLRKLTGDERSLGDIYAQELERERSRIEQFRETNPATAAISEFVGGMALPLGAAKNIKQAAGIGAGLGGVTGALSGEGGEGRLTGAAIGTVAGGILGAGGQKAADMIGGMLQRRLAAKAVKAANEGVDAVSAMKAEAGKLYDEVSASGLKIDPDSFDAMLNDTISKIAGGQGRPVREKLIPYSSDVLDAMKDFSGKAVGIEDLDYLRQLAQVPAGKVTDPAEQRAASIIINGIDDFVGSLDPAKVISGDAADVASKLTQARDLWSRMRKTEKISKIIEVAKRGGYAGGFESGIKNQFQTILRNPKQQRGFSKDELELMSEIVKGSPVGRILAGISYLGFSPSGGRAAPTSGLLGGMSAGALVGGAPGAAIGATLEAAATTGLRAIREMSLENKANLFKDIVASGKASQIKTQYPEIFDVLQKAASAVTRGTIAAGSPAPEPFRFGLLSQ